MSRSVRFNARKTVRFGPFYALFTQGGLSSYGIKLGPWTWNLARDTHSVDTPGPGGVRIGKRKRGRS